MWNQLEPGGSGLVLRCARTRPGVASARNRRIGQPVRKVCGVLTGAAGVKLGASLVDRNHVNMGTITALQSTITTSGRGRDRCIVH